jgi:hypothetical protein
VNWCLKSSTPIRQNTILEPERHSTLRSKKSHFEPSTTTRNYLASSPNWVARLVWLCALYGPLKTPLKSRCKARLGRDFSNMPDIDPAALSRPSISTTPILPPKTISAPASNAPKVSKSNHVPARIDLEPLYTALKSAIGEYWGTYKESISLFVMGQYMICLYLIT